MPASNETMRDSPATTGRLRSWCRSLYHVVLALPTGGRGIRRKAPGGERFLILPAFRYLDWNRAEYEVYRQVVQPGSVVLDIGANAGQYCLLFGRWAGPTGKVYAFEPAPEAFAGLSRHVELNDLAATVHCWQAAVSDRGGESSFLADGFQGTNRLATQAESAAARMAVRVACVTVDEFCAREGIVPTVIKIDVEGAELAVLRGARRTIRAGGKELNLFTELHPTLWPRFGYNREVLLAEMKQLGLVAIPMACGTDPWISDTGLPVKLDRQ